MKNINLFHTCTGWYYYHFYTGQRAKILDSPVKYRTPGNPTSEPWSKGPRIIQSSCKHDHINQKGNDWFFL